MGHFVLSLPAMLAAPGHAGNISQPQPMASHVPATPSRFNRAPVARTSTKGFPEEWFDAVRPRIGTFQIEPHDFSEK